MSMLRDPVWRRSPFVLFGYPVHWAGVFIGAAALSLSVLTGTVLVDAAGTASLAAVVDAVPESAPEAQQPGVRAFLARPVSAELDEAVTDALEGLPGVGSAQAIWRPMAYRDFDLHPLPIVSNPNTGKEEVAVLFTVTGGIDGLVTPGGHRAAGGGLWVPDVVADSLQVEDGDEVVVELRFPRQSEPAESDGSSPGPTSTVVAGVYATVDGDAMPEDPTGFWRSLAGELPAWPPFITEGTPQVPLLVADADTYRTLTRSIGEESLATWEVHLVDRAGMTIAGADRLAREVSRLDDEGSDPNASLGRLIAGETTGAFRVVSGIGDLADEARTARAGTDDGVTAMRVLTVGLSWTVVVLSMAAVCRRRRPARQVLVEAGRGPLELGLLSTVESLLPVMAGVVVAAVMTGPLVEAIVGARGRSPAPVSVVGIGLVVLLTLGATSSVDAWRLSRTSSGRAEDQTGRLPWKAVVVGAAVVAAIPVVVTADEAGFDSVTALFPLLALAAASIVVVEAIRGGLDRLTSRWLPKPFPARLVMARSARDSAVALALLATAVSFGAVGFGAVASVSVDQAISDKVAARAGANSAVRIPTSSLLDDYPEVMDGSTVVWRNRFVGLGNFVQEPLLAIDPNKFRSAGLWSDRNADRLTFTEALGLLTGSDGNSVPILVAGDTGHVPDGGILDRTTPDAVPYSVAARLNAFPGMGEEETLLIVDASSLFETLGDGAPTSPETIAEDDPDGPFTTEIWSSRPIDDLTIDLALAGIPFDDPRAISEFATQPVLLARGWALDYLRIFTLVAGALGVAILVGLSLRDRDRRQIQSATLVDFGYPRSTMTVVSTVEVATIGLVGSVVGTVLARWITNSVATRLDPLPSQAPSLETAGTQPALAVVIAFVVAALFVVTVAGAVRRPRSINELLRDE